MQVNYLSFDSVDHLLLFFSGGPGPDKDDPVCLLRSDMRSHSSHLHIRDHQHSTEQDAYHEAYKDGHASVSVSCKYSQRHIQRTAQDVTKLSFTKLSLESVRLLNRPDVFIRIMDV